LVSVLGTAFNFNTRNSEVALAEGSVKLNANGLEAFLIPGQMASYSKEKEVFTTSQFNPLDQLGWQKGVIYIEGYSIEKLVSTLEKWYGVEIGITGIDLNKEFSGELSNRSLENVLKGICFTLNCNYEINQDQIRLYGKK
jgi:ferric-dicitrate binding protein FerR (iron transport regulator)